ncbi:unnamed protein product [Paramecium sonneborni]|uniref:Uncharacterized protein n=1 Tax=Paramecium sonneborni TaxID=65129 RepID=A0A8S1NJP5_9CILI|nr:unnamed protein product [Paramecium sonneborni]CAD8086876.1 unnamed protein product [Paramecium sonneborni]
MQSQSIGEDDMKQSDDKNKDQISYCELYSFNLTYEEIQQESKDKNIKLIPDDKQVFFEIILKEQQMRLDKNYQDLYKSYSGNVEEMIRSKIFKQYGYDDCPTNHKLYYVLTQKFRNDPELKNQVFFWRNNVMKGCRVALNQEPPDIQLVNLENKKVSLLKLMIQCHKENRLLVVYSGSIT